MDSSPWTITVRWTVGGLPVTFTGADDDSLRDAGVRLAALLDILPLSVLAEASVAIARHNLSLDGSGLALFATPPTRMLWRESDAWVAYHRDATTDIRRYPTLDAALRAIGDVDESTTHHTVLRRLSSHPA